MLKYIIDIFCKDITIGLCQINRSENSLKNYKFTSKIPSKIGISPIFDRSISIGPIVYHL